MNGVKDQTEVAEILANYFTNAAQSIVVDHLNNFTEEDHTIRETHEETNFEFYFLRVAEVKQALEKKKVLWIGQRTTTTVSSECGLKGTAASLTIIAAYHLPAL